MPGPGPDGDRRVALRAAKLVALVRAHAAGDLDLAPATFPGGAALLARLSDADRTAWVYADEHPLRSLGGALAWAMRAGPPGQGSPVPLHLVVDDAVVAGHLARRAALFAVPVTVHAVDGRALVDAAPLPAPIGPAQPEALAGYVEVIRSAGADPVWEHGVLAGEVYGLEVCRVVDGDALGDGRGLRLEVGVGAADREAFRVMHGDHPTAEQVIELVHRVSAHRAPGAEPHALNRLGAERRLRAEAISEPSRIGARTLAAAPPPLPRTNLKDPLPCIAHGVDADGTALVVAFATGVDLELVPAGADARSIAEAASGAPARLMLAVAERDAHPALARLAAALRVPAELRVL